MFTLAGSSRLRGRSLDRRMSEVGQLISTSAHEVPEGYFQPVKELGVKFALGAASNTSTGEITNEPSVINLTETVNPELKKSVESMKHLDEPTIKLTGTLLDTLVSKGLSSVLEQLENSGVSKK
jgi:hypothetical protein